MTLKFHGKRKQLSAVLASEGIVGTWYKQPNGVRMLRCIGGGNLHWAKTTKSVWFDGKATAKAWLCARVTTILGNVTTQTQLDDQDDEFDD